MKTIERKIQESFAKCGITIFDGYIEYCLEWECGEQSKPPTKKQFVEKACDLFAFGLEGIVISDFELFRKKMEMDESWKTLPDWFTEIIGFEYSKARETYEIDSGGDFSEQDWLWEVAEGQFEFFEGRIKDAERGEYLLKKIFEPDSKEIQEKRKEMVRTVYKQLQMEMISNENFHKLSTRIKNLLKEEYRKVFENQKF